MPRTAWRRGAKAGFFRSISKRFRRREKLRPGNSVDHAMGRAPFTIPEKRRALGRWASFLGRHLSHLHPNRRYSPVVIVLALFVAGCTVAPVRPPARIDPEADRRIAALSALNGDLTSFKAIGTLRRFGPEGPQSARAAWIAQRPDRLRLELLGTAGVPLVSVAADGKRFDLYLHDRGKGYLDRSADAGLERLVGVPIETAEVVAVLGGRVLLVDFRSAALDGDVLVLRDGAGRVLQKIRPASPGAADLLLERYEPGGGLRYRVLLEKRRPVDGFTVPAAIRVTTEGREGLLLTIDRFWAHPDVAPGAFSLGKNGHAGREGR